MTKIFSDIIDQRYGRREVLKSGLVTAGSLFALPGSAKPAPVPRSRLGFAAVPHSREDRVIAPKGYRVEVLIPEGEPLIAGAPDYLPGDRNTGADRELQVGAHHDGMWFFPLGKGAEQNNHGLLCVNHENIDLAFLHESGGSFGEGRTRLDAGEVRKEIASHGVTVVELIRTRNGWEKVQGKYNRRITGETPMNISGPARGHRLMRTKYSPDGIAGRGTLNNCASGPTPWGTYLSCEENSPDYFVVHGDQHRSIKRYAENPVFKNYGWHTRPEDQYARFDATPKASDASEDYRYEPNQFGWVVEIDPFDPKSVPVKRTALGRMRHEGATVAPARIGKPLVIYMGDDARGEYVYKFVSRKPYAGNATDRDLLDEGTLFVARFEANGSGEWLALRPGANRLTPDNGFDDLGDILINTRSAADHVGATKLDRPESATVDPRTGDVYMTLTNNSKRGADAKQPVDGANPRAENVDGHILRWSEAGGEHSSSHFTWDIFAFGGPTRETIAKLGDAKPYKGDPAYAGQIRPKSSPPKYLGDDGTFNSPDGIFVGPNGILWILTDGYSDPARGFGHQQMLACDPDTGDIRRFLTGPKGCEITGITATPDGKTLFVNVQHPSEGSTWPNIDGETRPRSGTLAITRPDGRLVGG